MAKKKNADANDNTCERLVVTDGDRAKAKKWFERARELGDKRQFDYAVEYYVSGLEFSPNAVEEGCKPLHGCAVARRQTGGKKPGFKDSLTRSMTDKDAKRALVNALWLFGRDPDNYAYSEGIMKAAGRLRAEDTAVWAGGICIKIVDSMPKMSAKQFQALAGLFEELGERGGERNEGTFGVEAFQMGVQVLTKYRQRFPDDRTIEVSLKNMSTKLTILKGKYKDGESFTSSIANQEEQKDLHDEQRSVQTGDRVAQLIEKAEAAYQENPDDLTTLNKLIDLLCRREVDSDETRAIEILRAAFDQTGDYRRKQAADDIRIRQLNRTIRSLAKAKDEAGVKQAQAAALEFELAAFKERLENYPTDNRVKFEYGTRLFRATRYDDAIPVLQAARSDPKNRTACALYLGRCFFRKGYHAQAVTILEAGIAEHPFDDDSLAKNMQYWLGRAQEANGDTKDARNTFGKIVQIDYNYRDVRGRLDSLPG